MFPRLHVKDTEKPGGPRAPPRNKMALYEQLTIPSHTQRLTSSGSASILPPLPPNYSIGSHERGTFASFCNSPARSHQPEKLQSYSSTMVKLKRMDNNQQKSIDPTNLRTKVSLSLKQNGFSNFKNFSSRKIGDQDNYSVSASSQPTTPQRQDNMHNKEENQFTGLFSSSVNVMQLKTVSEQKQTSRDCFMDLKSSKSVRNRAECDRDNDSVDALSNSSSKFQNSEHLKQSHASWGQENKSNLVKNSNGLQGTNVQKHQESGAAQDTIPARDEVGKENPSMVRRESCSTPSLRDDNRNLNGLENGSKPCEDEKHSSVLVGNVERNDDASETSMADSVSAMNFSPDDVVGAIGEKQFWIARKEIVNQQRVFAVQVFELHRLIKVQRQIAESPHLMLDDNHYLGKPLMNTPSTKKKSQAKHALEAPPPLSIKPKDDSKKSFPSNEDADENVVQKLPLPSINNDSSKENNRKSNPELHPTNIPPSPMVTNTKAEAWCFNPLQGNQWLVPVVSSSEGLVYKPYTGPYPPPNAVLMAPMYHGNRDYFNAAYGVPGSYHQGVGIFPDKPPLNQTYFQPYGLQFMNQSTSSSAVEQMSFYARSRSNGQNNQLPTGNVNYTIPYQSSCNMSSHISGCSLQKLQGAKESELQRSTASSPCERTNENVLPLFPKGPTVQESDQNEQSSVCRTQVIKAEPLNPRSASESVARIFQSIQEERKRLS